jgi:hypothetical protein
MYSKDDCCKFISQKNHLGFIRSKIIDLLMLPIDASITDCYGYIHELNTIHTKLVSHPVMTHGIGIFFLRYAVAPWQLDPIPAVHPKQ